MLDTLFNPNGRITAGPFWQGVIILLILGVVLEAARVYGPPNLTLPLLALSLVLLYPSLCVYGKRFHDAGKSAWWFLAVLLVGLIAVIIASVLLSLPMIIEMAQQTQSGQTPPQPGTPEFQAMQRDMAKQLLLPSLAASTAINLVIAFVVSRLASDPGENKYGPPPGAAATSA